MKLNKNSALWTLVILISCLENFAEACGGNLNSPSDTISHSQYGHSYQYCAWVINAPGKIITLTFHEISTDRNYGYVNVYQKQLQSKTFELYKKYSGWFGKFTLKFLNSVKIELTKRYSGYYRSSSSLRATYETENYESKLLAVNSTHPVILSHNYFQNNYVGEQHTFFESIPSYYRISNADPTGYLTIHAETNTNFATKDYIFVYDGSSSKDKRIAHISSAPVKQTYLSTSKDLWVEVYTNKSFLLNITSGCRMVLKENKGFIISPGFPGNYNTRIGCTWELKIRELSGLSFVSTSNYMKIFGKFIVKDKNNSVIGEFDGRNVSRVNFNSNIDDIFITFFVGNNSTDSLSRGHKFIETDGFNISYSLDCPPITNTTGGYVIGNNHYGSSIEYVCDDGYYLVNGVSKQTCKFGGIWSQPKPFCEEWILPRINSTHDGFVKIGTEVTIECSRRNGLLSSRLFLVNEADIRIGNSPNVYLDNVEPIASNRYRCKEIREKEEFYSNWITINVTWLGIPKLSIEHDTVAVGRNVQFNCSVDGFPEITYRWFKDGNLISVTSEGTYTIDEIQLQQAGRYQCSVANEFGLELSEQKNISVWDIGNVLVLSTNEGSVSFGSNLTLKCNSTGNVVGKSFQWVNQNEMIVSNTSLFEIHKIKKNESAKYRCKVIKDDIVKISRVIRLTVTWLDKPVLNFQNNTTVVATFSKLNMRCNAKGHPYAVRYIWFKDNVRIGSSLTPNMELKIISTTFSGRYQCKAMNQFHERLSDVKRLQVFDLKAPQVISSHEGSVQKGSTINMTCSTTENQKISSISWVNNGGKIMSTSSSLVFQSATKENSGTYRCKLESQGAVVYSRKIRIKVTYLKKPVLQFFPSGAIEEGESVTLMCRVRGSTPITYQIIKDGQVMEIAPNEGTSLVLFYDDVEKSQTGNYSCIATNENGTTESNTALLEIGA